MTISHTLNFPGNETIFPAMYVFTPLHAFHRFALLTSELQYLGYFIVSAGVVNTCIVLDTGANPITLHFLYTCKYMLQVCMENPI